MTATATPTATPMGIDEPLRFEPGSARSLVKKGGWFRDAEGRYVLLRGVNFASRSKRPPYLPVLPVVGWERVDFEEELARVAPQLDLLPALGFNAVRLLVIWKALEPVRSEHPRELSPTGRAYLEKLRRVVDVLALRGLFVWLDFHQDLTHEAFGGDGFPDWMVEGNLPPRWADLRDRHWGLKCYALPFVPMSRRVRRTFARFWANRGGEQDHLAQVIGATAAFFKDHPAVLGYEPFNEPRPAGLPRPYFDSVILPGFFARVERALHEAGEDRAFHFATPHNDWNKYPLRGPEFQGPLFRKHPSTRLDLSRLDPARRVFAFHYYDPWTLWYAGRPRPRPDSMANKAREWPEAFREMKQAALDRDAIPFLTEFGATHEWDALPNRFRPEEYGATQTAAYLALQFEAIERHLLNSALWNFDLYNSVAEQDNWNLEDFSLLGPDRQVRHARIMSRPYPLRSSAEPRALSFELRSRRFLLELEGAPVDAPTVVFVPRVHYPNGFEVRAEGRAFSWDDRRSLLLWQPSLAAEHSLELSPRGARGHAGPPAFTVG